MINKNRSTDHRPQSTVKDGQQPQAATAAYPQTVDYGLLTIITAIILASMSLTSCATSYNKATGRNEMRLIDVKQEERIGESINQGILANYPKSGKPVNGEKVLLVGSRLVSSIDRRGIAYKFGVVRDENMNAFTIPGGYVYVTTGLLENISNDAELAAVMAHEIGHSEARHAVKRLEAALSYTTVMQMAYMLDMREEDKKGYWKHLKSGTDVVFSLMTLGYSRKDEYEADWLSIRYMKDAGYDPSAILTLMGKLKAKEAAGNAKWMYFLRSHPYLDERMEAVSRELSRNYGTTQAMSPEL